LSLKLRNFLLLSAFAIDWASSGLHWCYWQPLLRWEMPVPPTRWLLTYSPKRPTDLRWEVQFAVNCKLVRYCNTSVWKYHWNPLLWSVIHSFVT
jgi:hypothetical protein